MTLARFNTLPPKPEYIEKLRLSLSNSQGKSESELLRETKLTKTQLYCTIDFFKKESIIEKDPKTKKFYLKENAVE